MAGADVVLTCQAAGHPPPIIDWLKEGQVVQQGDNVTTISTLTISGVGRGSVGAYRCRATNELVTMLSETATILVNCKSSVGM